MTINRRELLGGLGAASASALLWAMGCRAPAQDSLGVRVDAGDVQRWLVDAVARLATAFPAQATTAHALACTRTRATAAIDVLGRGVSRGRSEGVVLRIQAPDGTWREQVTANLSREGIDAAARQIAGSAPLAARPLDFGPPAILATPSAAADDPSDLHDRDLLERVDVMASADLSVSSRIVYAASVLDLDDATLWSVALGRQRAQRIVRVRRAVTRVAWNGTRPVISELQRGWRGGLDRGGVDELALTRDEIVAVSEAALALMTPGELADGDYAIELAPAVVASVIDIAARELFTTAAARRPEVAARLALGATIASPMLSLVDDPLAAAAYGGFAFDDEGADAVAVQLLEAGRVVGRLADRAGAGASAAAGRGRRPGHVGPVEAAPSHLRLAPGTGTRGALVGNGLVVDGARGCVLDPSSDRVVIGARRADAMAGGDASGRKWADVEIVGELGALLAGVTAVSADTLTFPIRDELDGRPRWRSIEAPSLATRAHVRARRRAT